MPKTVMLAAFEGWNDACQAATNVIRHLVSRYDSQEIRHINDEGFYDYQVARPMICSVQGRRRIIWPQTTFYDITISPETHFLAQIAPEPNYRWEEYCRKTLRIAEDYDVNEIVTLGSMFADCPHTRPLPLDISKGDCECELDKKYNGPIGIPTSSTRSPPTTVSPPRQCGYQCRNISITSNACRARWSWFTRCPFC